MKKYNLEYLEKSAWTFVLIKSGQIVYRSKKGGLRPLVFCLKSKPTLLKNAEVYDKIVGRASACLMIYGQVKNVMTPAISRSALKEFKKYKIPVQHLKTTGKIMNREGDDLCPMEKLSKNKKPDAFARIMMGK